MTIPFKKQFSLDQRISESQRIISKYPDRIPIIIECSKDLDDLIKKRKFLVPKDISVSYLLYIVRRKIRIDSNKAVFMFSENKLLCAQSMIGSLYDEYINKQISIDGGDCVKGDRFFYITLSYENTFG